MSRFEGNWDSKEDMERDFDCKIDHNILYASYEYESYEGYSYVISEKDGTLYENDAGHCSCNGLEGCWTPSATTREALQATVDSWSRSSGRAGVVKFLREYLA